MEGWNVCWSARGTHDGGNPGSRPEKVGYKETHIVSALAPVETQLFVYGTLAPGRANEHQLASLQGTWEKAWVKELFLRRVGALRKVSLESD